MSASPSHRTIWDGLWVTKCAKHETFRWLWWFVKWHLIFYFNIICYGCIRLISWSYFRERIMHYVHILPPMLNKKKILVYRILLNPPFNMRLDTINSYLGWITHFLDKFNSNIWHWTRLLVSNWWYPYLLLCIPFRDQHMGHQHWSVLLQCIYYHSLVCFSISVLSYIP